MRRSKILFFSLAAFGTITWLVACVLSFPLVHIWPVWAPLAAGPLLWSAGILFAVGLSKNS
jgi:hypothetical protein